MPPGPLRDGSENEGPSGRSRSRKRRRCRCLVTHESLKSLKKKNEKSIEKYWFKIFLGVIFGGTLDGFKQPEL
jgi:hypothetical protein